jgi:DNA-binding Lrp family transcriptional regulator
LKFQKSFVFVKVKSGHEQEVADKLITFDEVKEVHIIPGEWDILAIVATEREIVAPSDEKVFSLVMNKIGKIKNVKDTNTIIPQFSRVK